jgi:hypothetical protein
MVMVSPLAPLGVVEQPLSARYCAQACETNCRLQGLIAGPPNHAATLQNAVP